MNNLIRIGFFKELDYGHEDGNSLVESKREQSTPNEDKIVEYLTNGILLLATPGIVEDYFDDSEIIGPPHILTDGKYAWPETLVYYVKNYHVKLPDNFIMHMEKNNWQTPKENEIDLNQLKFWLYNLRQYNNFRSLK